jgi:hypothetical protein
MTTRCIAEFKLASQLHEKCHFEFWVLTREESGLASGGSVNFWEEAKVGKRVGLMLAVTAIGLIGLISGAQASPHSPSGQAGAEAAKDEGLSLLSSANAVKVSASEGEDTAETHISVFNQNPKHATIDVLFEAASDESVHVKSVHPRRLPGGEVTRVAVEFEGLRALHEVVSGQLVISAGPDPIAQSVELTPAPQPSAPWPLLIVLVSLFGAIFVAGMVIGAMPEDKLGPLRYSAPGAKWEAKSWATTLTATGGLLGTVLGGVTFPSYPEQISKEVLVNLNLFFGVLVVVGPFLFQALRRKEPTKEDRKAERFGTNLTLLLTSTVTLWAVFGQLGAFGLLSWELISTEWLAGAVVAVLALLGVGAARYYFLTMSEAVVRNWSKEEEDAEKRAAKRRKKRQLEQANAVLGAEGEASVRAGGAQRFAVEVPQFAAQIAGEELERLEADPEAAEEPEPQAIGLL